MIKNSTLFCFLVALFIGTATHAQWSRTNLVTTAPLPLYDIEFHKGAFYATAATDFIAGKVVKYENQSWSDVTISGLLGIPQYIASNDEYIYVSTSDLFTGSYLYVSSDNGQSFSLDTMGISKQSSGVSTILSLEIFGDDILVGVSGGFFHKDLSTDGPFSQFTTPTLLNGGTDQVIVDNGKMYAYDNAGALTMYVSDDYGSTWTTPANNGLPSLTSSFMEIDPITKRIFVAGRYDSGSMFGVYFTDSEGATWNMMDLSSFGTTSYTGGLREATALNSYNGDIHLALNNDKENTALDIFRTISTNNELVDYDTTGIYVGSGTVTAAKFARSTNQMAVILNQYDVYIKDLTISGLNGDNENSSVFYPNPATNQLHGPAKEARLINTLGHESIINFQNGSVDISALPKGIYIIDSGDYKEKIVLE